MGLLNRFVDFLKSASPQKRMVIVTMFLILAALPLTVIVAQQQQNTKQEAATTCTQEFAERCNPVGSINFQQCEKVGASLQWVPHDCGDIPNTICQIASDKPIPGGTAKVPNVSCVYTCNTAAAVAAGERCRDEPYCPSENFTNSTSGHICDPPRTCCKLKTTECIQGVNSDCTIEGATQCNLNKAAVQRCQKDPTLGCLVWTNTLTCTSNSCVQGSGGATCSPTGTCTNGAVRCFPELSPIQPQICTNGNWISNGSPCAPPSFCNNRTGKCETRPSPKPTSLSLSIGLDGLGSTGDDRNPNPARSNPNPIHKTHPISVVIKNSSGAEVDSKNGNIAFASDGKFKATITLKEGFPTGTYSVTVRVPNYIGETIVSSLAITAGTENIPVSGNLTTGDIDNDNDITILDYGILISCYRYSQSDTTCKSNANNKTLSDLTDNGTNDQDDYNLHLREWLAKN